MSLTTTTTKAAGTERKRAVRRRKHHQKSRLGCGNCKMRRIKCDETQPSCANCTKFLVSCNYDSLSLNVKPAAAYDEEALSFQLQLPLYSADLANKVTLAASNQALRRGYPDRFAQYELPALDLQDLDRLKRWQTRTVLSIANPASAEIYQKEVIKLVADHPYLLHAVLASTAMHDRYLSNPLSTTSTAIECYHQCRSAALFNAKLSTPLDASSRNAIWTTAALLGHMAFFTLPTTDPEKSWPLAPATPSQFEWLRLQEGIRLMWTLANPIGPGGMFHELAQRPHHDYLRHKVHMALEPGIQGLPAGFVELCELAPESDAASNPYHSAVRVLAGLLDAECTPATFVKFITFTALMTGEFKGLLAERDPRALLLVAFWYGKIRNAAWFVKTRAMVEGRAICLYLERFYGHDEKLMRMLGMLKEESRFGEDEWKYEGNALGSFSVGGQKVPGRLALDVC